MTKKIRILIADDHTMVRQGLSQICDTEADLEVIGQAANGDEARRLADHLRPHVVIMDINMPVLDGVQATQQITAAHPEMGVIILRMYRQDEHVFEAIKAGARAYLLKEADSDELLSAIRSVAVGEALLDPIIARKMIDEFRRLQESPLGADALTPLTPRDLDILRLVAQGLDNSEIGQRLALSDKTVRNRLTGIFEVLHVSNRTQAALYALRKGLARLDDTDAADEEH